MTRTLFLAGDVMTGRGLDQVLERSVGPRLHEPYVKDARLYVEMAEEESGPIATPVAPSYPWGDALEELERTAPDVRIVNLETAVTTSDDPWQGKGIHYRMHPENVSVLTAAGLDCAVVANNHVMDWGAAGLGETLDVLRDAGIATTGGGRSRTEAREPAVLSVPDGGRVLCFAYGLETAGVPRRWAAGPDRPGVSFLEDLSEESLEEVAREVGEVRREDDLVVVSLHWGPNWGYEVGERERRFAHGLVDRAGAHVVYGHSSHHPRGIELYRDRPILYGCGDFLNDYEGIGGKESFRGDLVLMYFFTFQDGDLAELRLTPLQIHRFSLRRPSPEDAGWLRTTLDRESRKLGAAVTEGPEGAFEVRAA